MFNIAMGEIEIFGLFVRSGSIWMPTVKIFSYLGLLYFWEPHSNCRRSGAWERSISQMGNHPSIRGRH